ESGIALAGDSSLLLNAESGISLAGPNDSGIALDSGDKDATIALDVDSGISLDAGESGISLDSGDSGISLEGDSGISLQDKGRSTIPMMDIVNEQNVAETQFEIPALEDDSTYDLQSDDSATGVIDMQPELEDDS